jgi:riboflavin kinase/FMN adenylyltransferase
METIFLNQVRKTSAACVATVGMFDGVHRGHQHVIGRVVERAREAGLFSTVITFDRVPRQVLDPSFRPQLLTTLEEKETIIRQLGVDVLAVLPFTRETAGLSAQAFMKQVLHEQLQTKVLVTGYDNRFGHDRTEGFDDYVRYGRELGMEVLRGDAQLMDDGQRPVSSSVIRQLLAEEGRVDLMPHYLTRLYQLRGTVAPGEHIGHRLGYPTANLEVDEADKLIPAAGVYAVWATIEGEQQPRAAMMNIGNRPTFHGHRQTLEVNILDFEGNLYGQVMTVSFVERLRAERRFDSPEALAVQLEADKEQVKQILG